VGPVFFPTPGPIEVDPRVAGDSASGGTQAGAQLDESELENVAGGFNPQPEPPGRIASLASQFQFNAGSVLGY